MRREEKRGEDHLSERQERQEMGGGGEERDGGRGRVHEGEDFKVVMKTKGGIGGLGCKREAPECVSSEDQIKWNNSHVKAQVLLLLKEVVQDVLPDKVWV